MWAESGDRYENKYDKEYEAFRIFEQIQGEEMTQPLAQPFSQPLSQEETTDICSADIRSADAEPYYEIEYDSCPMPGVGRFVLKSQKIEAPVVSEKDEVRELFQQMRDIAREERTMYFGSSKFYDRRVQQESARIFYRQGMFMKDFEDDYEKIVPYSSYFPNYQMMGYDQLRTYFTWRTQVRRGDIAHVSLSYAFLYLYELLNNIGVENPQDGLEKLMLFWEAFRVYDRSVDKYVLKWLKDYYIYYELPQAFREFIEENNLGDYYPQYIHPEDRFEFFCAISKYDIRKSTFYTEENRDRIKECFLYVLERVREAFAESHIVLDEFIFQPAKSMTAWTPFKGALFSPVLRQPDRRVILSEKEIYVCAQNRWTHSTVLTAESGRRLIAYCLKQTEAVLRELTKYKYKLCANMNMLSQVMADELRGRGLALDVIVADAVREYYREANKTVVRVDSKALDKIRQEAFATQQRLTVPEQESSADVTGIRDIEADDEDICRCGADAAKARDVKTDAVEACRAPADMMETSDVKRDVAEAYRVKADTAEIAEENLQIREEWLAGQGSFVDPWRELRSAFTTVEQQALRMILDGSTDIKHFADENGIMLEVLIDGINEKTMDYIGDSLLEDEYTIYEDYTEQVKGMVDAI